MDLMQISQAVSIVADKNTYLAPIVYLKLFLNVFLCEDAWGGSWAKCGEIGRF